MIRGVSGVMALRCSVAPLPDSVASDIQNMRQLSEEVSRLCSAIFSFLKEQREADQFTSQLEEFAKDNGISLGPLKSIVRSVLLVLNGKLNCKIWSMFQTENARRMDMLFLSTAWCYFKPDVRGVAQHLKCLGALRRSLKSEDLQSDLIVLGLDEEKARIFAKEWSSDAPALMRLAVGRTLGINQLVDMEWKFGVTAASSELEKAGTIFLQLKMIIKKGNQLEPVYVELTLPQFYSFLHEMERAKSSLECFT
ncbi:COMM domain-containing protein 7 isoform X2 [Ranitomeya imitator]|uniref:COMM domain-containing protein 7 isoform X2 n=1 Tax=Ranitomeya imitator TaxID=111125 RepID=UPI0037E76B2C